MALLGRATAATAWPVVVDAQEPARVRRVGYIAGADDATMGHIFAAFRQRLTELGYVEGRSIALEVRWAEGRVERLPELVSELIRLKSDVLVAGNSVAAIAAKKATQTIPIVMVAADPVGLSLVESLARPGENVTGLSYFNEAMIAKRLQLLKEMVPGLVRVAVMKNAAVAIHAIFWRTAEAAARTLGVELQPLEVGKPEDFDAAFAAAMGGNAQALIVFDDVLTIVHRPRIIVLAAAHRLPAVYGLREFPKDGGLMSFGASFVVLFRRAATYVDKILKGAKPADLPVEQPTTFELVINRRTANALGLTVPPTLLAQADEVIE
ncbi:ABC transporter substrate-binding protein [Bradyrhizobium yuanmingense]|uniref:ABC transporter substrate-binding protein n=1 Tax=Bradyrhizobium yuanmingense TaxID=108015 RepID=UPI0023BA2084|nr:ABC transporter substrate-binding protein [Bradyrhizobium yuanmingense]MDF0516423.1 ABC transporter substrate-binding protein [Bradyrhizobium yuanmingense]